MCCPMCWLELTDFLSAFDELGLLEGSIIYMILGVSKGGEDPLAEALHSRSASRSKLVNKLR